MARWRGGDSTFYHCRRILLRECTYKTRNACVAGWCEMLQGLLLLVALPPLHDRLSERVQTVPVRPTVQIGRPPQVWQITPSGASGAGNVTVVLSGAALVDYGDVRCKFCSVEVRGYVLHSGAVSCIAPPASAIPSRDGSERANVILPTACIVDVTLHGPDGYTGVSTVVFHYFNISQVTVALMQPSNPRITKSGAGRATIGRDRCKAERDAFRRPWRRWARAEVPLRIGRRARDRRVIGRSTLLVAASASARCGGATTSRADAQRQHG